MKEYRNVAKGKTNKEGKEINNSKQYQNLKEILLQITSVPYSSENFTIMHMYMKMTVPT